jgi:cell division protein FtsW (lipid II flippase)
MAQVASRRNSELFLLIVGLLVGAGALVLVALALNEDQVSKATPYIVALVIGYVTAHIVVRKVAPQGDQLILPITAVLNALGLAAIFRLSTSELDIGPTQVVWTVVGIICFVAALLIIRDFRVLARYKYIFGFAGIGLLLLPLSPLGREINGARLWLKFGSYSFQPGELAKLCLVVFFAAYLAERKELLSIASRRVMGLHVPDLKHFGPLLVMWGVSLAVMFFEKDLGSSLLFFAIFLVMLYIATARIVYMLFGLSLFTLGAYVGYQIFPHVQDRVEVWLNVFDPKLINDEAYQLAQSLFALATGGLFGTGFGRGRPDLIPAAHTDFVYSVIGEELGMLGTTAVLVCFMVIVARGLRIALNSRDEFGQLLTAGLTAVFAIQTFIILAGVTGLLPLTGITLPFMSYGGSSLLSNFILLALLITISHRSAAEPPPAETAEILIGGRR